MNQRRLWAGCAALATTITGVALSSPATAATAATAPRAPYTELRMDGAYGSSILGAGGLLDKTGPGLNVGVGNNWVTMASTDSTVNFQITGGSAGPGDWMRAGNTYETDRPGAGTNVSTSVSVSGKTCSQLPGELSVLEATRDGNGLLTSFAATYTFSCDGSSPNVGEIRWDSTVDHIAFAPLPPNATSAPQTLTVTPTADTSFGEATFGETSSGTQLGDSPDFPFRVVSDTCSGQVVTAGTSCTLGVTAHPTVRGGQMGTLTLPDAGATPVYAVSVTSVSSNAAGGSYTAITPARLLDTRTTNQPLTAGQIYALQVSGRGGVPTTGVSAVVLNMTVTQPSRAGNIVAYPAGSAVPLASTVNFNGGWTGASLATVLLGTGGKVHIKNAVGTTHVIADVVGYYRTDASTTAGSYGGYYGGMPTRLLDTRQPGQGPALSANEALDVSIGFNNPDDPYNYNGHIRAVAVNITAVGPTAAGHFTVWNGTGAVPNTSTLNFAAGKVAPNMAIVPTTSCGWCADTTDRKITILNASKGMTHLIVDLVGYYDDNAFTGMNRFKPLSPTRIVDSRYHVGAELFGPGATQTVLAPETVAGLSTYSLVTTLTAAAPQKAASIALWPNSTIDHPRTSNLNPYAGQYVSNMTITDVWTNNDFNMWNSSAGSTNLVVDVLGSMEHYPSFAPTTGFPAGATARQLKTKGAAGTDAKAGARKTPALTFSPRGLRITSDASPARG